jgi:peroxiredoxin
VDRVWRRQAVLLPLAAAVAVAGAIVWSRVVADDGDDVVLITPGEYADPASTNAENAGDVFPSFELTGADGAAVSLAPGDRPLVVNLWYSTCPPCSRELTAFGTVAADLSDEVRFVGVNPLDDAETMVSYAADRGVDYELLMDPDEFVGTEFGVLQYPVTFFVATDGEIIAQTGVLSEDELREQIAELVA